MEFPENLAELSDEQLAELITQARSVIAEFVASENPTPDQLSVAEAAEKFITSVEDVQTERTEAASRAAAIRDRHAASVAAAEAAAAEPPAEVVPEVVPEPAPQVVEVAPVAVVDAPVEVPVAAALTPVAPSVASVRVPRPPVPAGGIPELITITAAADVPEYSTGQSLGTMEHVATALINRTGGFTPPNGSGKGRDLRKFGVATIRRHFPEDLVIDETTDHMAVMKRAGNELLLPGGSLVAAGGWCTPSENLYDLCERETTEGLLSIPEVQVKRGGINFTKGPDFADLFAAIGFEQTEAQAIAGDAKDCYEVVCPDWNDHRLDAIGVCIMVPILTNSAYPELIQRVIRGGLVAHQHKVSRKLVDAIVTLAGTPKVLTDLTSTSGSLFSGLELLADQNRQKFLMSFTETMEILLPFWVKGALRSDLSLRTGKPVAAVTDAMIAQEFSVRRINVQYLYGFQPLDEDADAYPNDFDLVMYPSGTYVKGTNNIINLQAVYDAASLQVNTYTGVFYEEGVLLAEMCLNSVAATVAVCNSGRTGKADIAECAVVGP